jgi:hypothetical protein
VSTPARQRPEMQHDGERTPHAVLAASEFRVDAGEGWWRWEESNLRHRAYETPAWACSIRDFDDWRYDLRYRDDQDKGQEEIIELRFSLTLGRGLAEEQPSRRPCQPFSPYARKGSTARTVP